MQDHDRIRQEVRAAYGAVARAEGSGGCCGSQPVAIAADRLGYSREDLAAAPEGANLGLGCGNPGAIAALRPGETVLDLGSGAGFDCFLAARAVGETGRVIGVDMTPDMIGKARTNADNGGYANVEFRLGEIEALPVSDASADVVISNCVINLSPDKARVFREAFRVLKPGGRLAISDVVARAPLPEEMRQDLHLHSCCIGGASPVGEIEAALKAAGFTRIRIAAKDESREFIREWAGGADGASDAVPGRAVEDYVVSANIEAVKPGATAMKPEADDVPPLHASIVSLVALAANIAANHPKQGLCQVEKLRDLGVPEAHVRAVIDIARHIRDEAGQSLDAQFDEKAEALLHAPAQAVPDPAKPRVPKGKPLSIPVAEACCTPTAGGQSCC
jgi:arsenite methyltransferase